VAPSKAEARRAAEALFARAGDVLHAGARVVTGRRESSETPTAARAPEQAAEQPEASIETARPAPSGDEAAARIDAARERLRARIAPPAEENPEHSGA